MSTQCPQIAQEPHLSLNKPPNALPRVWPHLTITQRQQLAQQLAYLIQRYRQPHLKEDNHDHS
jgi:hypothetical protein